MRVRDPTVWMWGEALDMLERADRLQRQFCQLHGASEPSPVWEPPIDIFETDHSYVIVVALPGVAPGHLDIQVDGTAIIVRGQRRQPAAAATCRIHRMELPYGWFERRIELPGRRLQLSEHQLADGCLTLTLDKLDSRP
ncbi:MAG: Hsp20/alpha crystallin family protein [Telluria sp.]